MKDLKVGLAVLVVLAMLWAGLQAFEPKSNQEKSVKSESSSCESSGGG